METNTTSVELSLPTDEEYIIQIRPFGEGGEGSSSRQITIPKISGRSFSASWLIFNSVLILCYILLKKAEAYDEVECILNI